MDHSEDEDSKLPARQQPQQRQYPPGSAAAAQHGQPQQPQWNPAAAAPQQYPQAPYAAALPQQQQQQQLAPGQPGFPPQQQQPPAAGVAGYPAQQHLLYQQQPQQQAAYPGYPAGAIPPQQAGAPAQPYAALQPSYYPPQVQPAVGAPPPAYLQPSPQVPVPQPYLQPKVGRLPADRPLIKLSVSLIDTYKNINTVYYENREARRAARQKEKAKATGGHGGVNNNGWDDENYDYIITQGEMFYGRYKIKERIGKGSFGQVVRAEDTESHREVAIKIIKSKKPFLMQAKTEIELLTHLREKDLEDQHNIVKLLNHFMYRNHQCLVFEMLSLNLYELLKNTQFGGVSLNLIRKFAKQVLKALAFLAKSDVDIIHCDLKPENILLRHPKKSGVKVIDFGSSCRSNKRMYSYIQSRFYRSPEVMLGLPYSVAIDMWSLGCILAEMHTGEPLFSGSDQFDQMQKIVKLLGNVPAHMLEKATDQTRSQFFEKKKSATGEDEWKLRQTKPPSSKSDASTSSSPQEPKEPIVPSTDPIASLSEIITTGNRQKKKFPPSELYNSQRNYELFVDLVYKMLAYEPEDRIKPLDALNHPFIEAMEPAIASMSTPSPAR